MKAWAAAVAAAVWAGMIPLQNSIDRDRRAYRLSEEVEFQTVQELLFQAISDFRIAVSNFLWIRVDQYLHLYAVREQLEKGESAAEHTHDENCDHEHNRKKEKAKPPSREALEFRRQMESEVMPLIRIVTWLDPHFILAYQVGAWTLADRLKKPEEAEKFLREGIRHNPNSHELYSELGFTYFFYLKEYAASAQAFGKALSFPISDFHEKKKIVRMYAYGFEKSGQIEKAVAVLEKYVKIDPKNKKSQQRLDRLKQQLTK